MRPEPEGRPLSRSIQGPEGPCSLRHGRASIKPCTEPEQIFKMRRPARHPILAPSGPDRYGGSVGLQPHEIPPARFSRNRVRGEAAHKFSRPPQSRVAPSFAFFQRRVGNHNHHTEGAWGLSPTKPPTIFREIKYAAKPRPNLAAAPFALIERTSGSPRRETRKRTVGVGFAGDKPTSQD